MKSDVHPDIAALIEVFGLGIDYGLLLAEEERDSEDMFDAFICVTHSRRMCQPSAPAPRRHPHSSEWRKAKHNSLIKFIEIVEGKENNHGIQAEKTKYYPMPDEVRATYFTPLINKHRQDLAEAKFILLFRDGRWRSKDKDTWASVKKVGEETKAMLKEAYRHKFGPQDDTPAADFVITVNYSVWQRFEDNEKARFALLHHELCHCFKDNDKLGNPKYSLIAHDLEEFVEIVRLYGNWCNDCKRMFAAMKDGDQQVIQFPGSITDSSNDEKPLQEALG